MAIPLTPAQEAEKDKKIKKPRQLVEIDMGGVPIRFCTGDNITWDGKSFAKAGLKVSNVKTGKAGVQSCRIQVIDTDHILKELAINTGFTFRDVWYWKVWGEQPYAVDDPILDFTGEIIRVPSMGSTIVFDCMTKNVAQRKAPNVVLGPPDIHHLPRPGQKLLIGNELYIVELD